MQDDVFGVHRNKKLSLCLRELALQLYQHNGEFMDVFEAIYNRHSQKKVKQDPVPRELIENILSAGVQAPNHYKVRPWRFVVLMGNARDQLGEVMAASLLEQHPDFPQAAFDKARTTPLQAPVIIAAGADRPTEAKVLEIENICAVAAACQNILLAAHALGLGAKWRTGEWARDSRVKEFLGFAPDQHLIAFLYIGYPEFVGPYEPRPSFEDRTVWMD
jgi:nitroreductase